MPDELAKEIVRRRGVIGLCLLREYLHPDPSREPFYFPEHADAGCYQQILRSLGGMLDEQDLAAALAFRNALAFIKRAWGIQRRLPDLPLSPKRRFGTRASMNWSR